MVARLGVDQDEHGTGDISSDELGSVVHDAVFIGVGLGATASLNIPGEDARLRRWNSSNASRRATGRVRLSLDCCHHGRGNTAMMP